MPCLMRGAHAALSPGFGALAAPVPWHAKHVAWNTALPSAAPAAAPPADAAADAPVAGAAAVAGRSRCGRGLRGRCGRRCGLGELRAGLIRHVGDGARDFDVGQIRVTAARRHLLDALDRLLGQRLESFLDVRRPRSGVADFRRVERARRVTRRADRFGDLLAGADSRRTAARCDDDLTDGLQAFRNRFFGVCRARVDALEREAREHRDDADRDDESENDDCDQLLRRLDERGVLVVRMVLAHADIPEAADESG